MKKFIVITLVFILLTSCSKDDSEFIVGQWQVTARFESQIEVELYQCDPFIIYEFNDDFSMRSFTINEGEIPGGVICGLFPPNTYKWEKVDDNMYVSNHVNTPDLTIFYTVESGKLLVDYGTHITAVYSRR